MSPPQGQQSGVLTWQSISELHALASCLSKSTSTQRLARHVATSVGSMNKGAQAGQPIPDPHVAAR
jgi:hypothetical protein